MYAIFEDGSHQYKVSEGQTLRVDYRDGSDKGTRLEFGKVLLYSHGDDLRIGQPLVEGLRVIADVVDIDSVKCYIGKYKRRKNYRRFKGHRQYYTKVLVRHILLPGQDVPPPAQPQPAAPVQPTVTPPQPTAPATT
jgi:large subunit ribosomal protein L21